MIVRQKTGASHGMARLQVQGLIGFTGDLNENLCNCQPQQNDVVTFTGVLAAINHSVLLVLVESITTVSP